MVSSSGSPHTEACFHYKLGFDCAELAFITGGQRDQVFISTEIISNLYLNKTSLNMYARTYGLVLCFRSWSSNIS